MLRISLIGAPVVELDGRPLAVDTRKAIAILAYLTVEGATRRDTLTGLLWAESPEARARAVLRRTLSSLRSAVGSGHLIVSGDELRLGGGTWADVREFERLVSATHDHGPAETCDACLPGLGQALGLYRGPLLAGFSVREAPAFEDWTRSTAEDLRRKASDVCDRLSNAHAAKGDYSRAIAVTGRWIELDPLREPAYRRSMLLHAWTGDRAGAIEVYRSCVAVLDRELGVSPLEETVELYQAILDEDLPPAPSAGRSRPRHLSPRPVVAPDLVDRADQLAAITGLATGDGGRVGLVVGAPWMGKTRLLEEAKEAARREGRPVLEARGTESLTPVPHGVLYRLLDLALRDPATAPAVARLPDWIGPAVARLHPGYSPEPSESVTESQLLEAVAAILTASPATVLVDDAHLVDPATLTHLTFLVTRIPDSEANLVLSYSPDPGASLGDLLEAARSVNAAHLHLTPLTVAELEGVDPGLAESAIARGGGIPALVAAVLRGEEIEAGVREFMRSRLGRLDDLDHQILVAAAVIGTVDDELLVDVSGRSPDETLASVDRLLALQILRVGATGSIDFALESLRDLVYGEMSPMRRRLLHRRTAGSLASRNPRTPAAMTTLAHHLQLGGNEVEASHWHLRAADGAAAVYAWDEADHGYSMALTLGHPDISRIHLGLGDVALARGRISEAIAEFEKAAAFGEPEQAALAEHRLGEANRRLGRLAPAIMHFSRAEPDHPDRVALYADWTLGLLRQQRRAEARERAQAAVGLAESGAGSRARALTLLGMVSVDRSEAEAALRSALRQADQDPVVRIGALNALAYHLGEAGDHVEPFALVSEAIAVAERLGDRHRLGALLNHLADIHHRAGRPAEARASLTRAVELLAGVEPGSWEPEVWLLTLW